MTLTHTVIACDAAGNCSGESEPASVTITGPNTAPSVTITEPGGHTLLYKTELTAIQMTSSLCHGTNSAGNDGILTVSGSDGDDDADERQGTLCVRGVQ